MTKLKVGSITLIVNGYYINNGKPYFQRSVPSDLRKRVGKSKISIPLKPEHGHVAVQCQRLSDSWAALFKAMRNDPNLTPTEVKQAAISKLALFGLKAGDGNVALPMSYGHEGTFNPSAHLETFEDSIEDDLRRRDPVAIAAYEALRKPMPVLLSEAFAIYLDNHQKGNDRAFEESQSQHWIKFVMLTGDIPLTTLTREHAKAYRDHRLNTGVKAATVKRELNTLAAIVNKAFAELTINQKNPFANLTIHKTETNISTAKQPYSRAEITKLVSQALTLNDERRRIVIVLALTGARLAEIVGLRRQDVDLSSQSIRIVSHPSRSLKTLASQRSVPLLLPAFAALKDQLSAHDDDFVFPTYAAKTDVKSDSASAALNKWAKTIVSAPNRTMHSFRHTLRDQLRAVNCPNEVSKAIGGWSDGNDVSSGYGLGYELDVKRKWLAEAYAWLVETP
jgi:integrase